MEKSTTKSNPNERGMSGAAAGQVLMTRKQRSRVCLCAGLGTEWQRIWDWGFFKHNPIKGN